MSTITKDLGIATAYGYAKSKGYTGTEEEFAELMYDVTQVAEEAEGYAAQAASSAQLAGQAASSAGSSMGQAMQAAANASSSATSAANSATSASNAATVAGTNAATAGSKAAEASGSANNAQAYATQASGAEVRASAKAGAAETSATNANTSALKSEGHAVGQQNGTDVGSSSPYYHNNAKYYAEQAAASAQTLVIDDTLTQKGQAADAKKVGDEISDLKGALNNLSVDLIPTIYSDKTVRISGLINNSDNDTYRYEIPDNISSIHILTNFYGNSRIVFTNQSSDAVFSNFPMEAYPEIGYTFPTTVDADFQTNGYKYAYVPIYKVSGVIPKAFYSEKEIINNKVDKSGIGQIKETNTTFFEEIPSKNILSLADSEITESPLTLVIEDNHVNTTISENLTSRVMPIFSEITLTPGTYTCGVYADEDYANYGGGVFIGLYKGINKNELYQYVYCTYAAGTYKTFTVEEDITLYLRFRTQDIAECNTNYATFSSIGCQIIISKTSALIPWVSPDPTYNLIWPATETQLCANAAMFETIGVIGDSYASGQIYLSGSPVNYYNLSWGQVLARRIGSTCINFSSGGLTTKTWLAAEKGLPLLQSSPAQGLYIVALGINDYTEISSSRYTLGTSADFDLSDYMNTPDTFYGNMCKIIGYIQAKSPNAKIILSTMAKNQNTLQKNINNAILTCATFANIGAIKQYEDGFFNSDYYVNGMISGHPTAPVYSGMAKAIERLIDKCMNDNYDYFYTYTWSAT